MKLRLSAYLLFFLTSTICCNTTCAAELPEGYEPIVLNRSFQLGSYSVNTIEDSFAFLVNQPAVYDPSALSNWTATAPLVSGGNLFFSSYNVNQPVSISFKEGSSTAFTGQTALCFADLQSLSFLNISSSSNGAAISLAENSVFTVTSINDGVDNGYDIVFESNTVTGKKSIHGGAIYTQGSASSVQFNQNGNICFKENTASTSSESNGYYSRGGAISSENTTTFIGNSDISFLSNHVKSLTEGWGGAIYSVGAILMSNNKDIAFTDNDISLSRGSEAYGGAIYANNTLTIEDNEDITFSNNEIYSYYDETRGGAVCSMDTFLLNKNNNVSIENNMAKSAGLYSRGGAIYADNTLEITNNADVSICSNASYSSMDYSCGGAICCYEDFSISNNQKVNFENNYAYSYSSVASSNGGAIYATGTILINNNSDVTFLGNYSHVRTKKDYQTGVTRGGAICANGVLKIQGNGSVTFERNYERNQQSGEYRLRSIYHAFREYYNKSTDIYLSAKDGGNITFYDSIYSEGNTYLNASYTDADGITQTAGGDVILSGKYTETHLNDILDICGESRVATSDEILNSQTSEFDSIYLHGGSFQIIDGAKVRCYDLSIIDNTHATLLLKSGSLNLADYTLSVGYASSLELHEHNYISAGNVLMKSGTSLSFNLTENHHDSAALYLDALFETSSLAINVDLQSNEASGMYQLIALSDEADYNISKWDSSNITVTGSGAADSIEFGDLLWQDGVLYYLASPLWTNHAGSMIWNYTESNWNNGSNFCAGENVIFTDNGAGEIVLEGDITAGVVRVNSTLDYSFVSSSENDGKLVGSTSLRKEGSGILKIYSANTYNGNTELLEGELHVLNSSALGDTSNGSSSVITEVGTLLKVDNSSDLVISGNENSIKGNVEVSQGSSLTIKDKGYVAEHNNVQGSLAFVGQAASTSAGILSGSGNLTVSDSSVSFDSSSDFNGNICVKGEAAALILNKGGYKGNGTISITSGSLSIEGRGYINLESGGMLEASKDAQVSALGMTVYEHATLSVHDVLKQDNDSLAEANINLFNDNDNTLVANPSSGMILNCEYLTLHSGSNLVVNGAHIDLNGGYLALYSTPALGITLTLSDSYIYGDETIVMLFSNVNGIDLYYDSIFGSSMDEKTYSVAASNYFNGAWINASTTLNYDSQNQIVYLRGVNIIPEPTTATLSLLALAGLAARRRRK